LATGNVIPALPAGLPAAFGNSKRYFGNPWKKACVEIQDPKTDVLIIGNGLTMVDTVIGLVEHGFKCNIHTISPNGYQLKPASDANPSYPDADIKALMQNKPSLLTIVSYLNKHRKIAVDSNRSFLPVIDAFRPYSQQTWQRLSFGEKKRFLKYFSNAWNTVRHRLPVMMYAFMEKMQTEKRLFTNRGGIISINETNNKVIVTLNCGGEIRTLGVQSVINCTGPGSNLSKSANKLLRNIASKALICPDALNMGINADPETGMVITADGCCNPNLYAIGGNLKGMLWESTAVPELRTQAKMLAAHLLKKCRYSWQLNPVA